MNWTDEETAIAIDLRRRMHSAFSIGKIMGRTRNSVIGRLHRVGEPGVLLNSGRTTRCDKPRAVVMRIMPSSPRTFSWEKENNVTG